MTLPLMLRKLHTTARILQVTAHPDDEDGGMLALESWGKGNAVMLMTLTRGEGGQNKVGSNLFDELGILRTLELLESDKYYGVEQRFSRVADFGFSKTADETFQKWNGHDVALADIVRVIRTFQPDILIARFDGSPRDGHGNHQASAILTREAFRAAGDPNRFAEQIKEGLMPWQAKKLYTGNVHADEAYTIKLETSMVDPLLGVSYAQLALAGLRHQLSQGAGAWQLPAGPRFTYYKLQDTTIPNYHPEHEQDFTDGIDTSLPGLAKRSNEASPARSQAILRDLEKATAAISKTSADGQSTANASTLFQASEAITSCQEQLGANNAGFQASLKTKGEQLREALQLAVGIEASATYDAIDSSPVVAGAKFNVKLKAGNNGEARISMCPGGYRFGLGAAHNALTAWPCGVLPARGDADFALQVEAPLNSSPARQFFYRDDPETDTVYKISEPSLVTLPLTPSALRVGLDFSSLPGALPDFSSQMETRVCGHTDGGPKCIPATVLPEFSILVAPVAQVIPAGAAGARPVSVNVLSNVSGSSSAELRLELPAGWHAEPVAQKVSFDHASQQREVKFDVFPAAQSEGRAEIRAVLDNKGKKFSEGYSLVWREDLDSAYYYQPAAQHVSVVQVKLPKALRIGYITGTGDDIPTVLGQIGLDVTTISPEELASGDLSRYGTIVLGIRAYDTRDDVKKSNQRLLDFVKNGGTLVVQYNTDVANFNGGHFAPYPLEIARDRVSVEEQPVEILRPNDAIFSYPNRITARDFDNWVQERGLNFPYKWDAKFEPLLSSHDPGEPALEGGLLRAHYGNGVYIYNAYSFFRELPAGVPGAVRLYVNLLSAGHEPR